MIGMSSTSESVAYFEAIERFMHGDYALCIDDFMFLSEKGDARASLYAAEIFNRGGDGVNQNWSKARDLYRRSLSQSYLPGAALGLALMLYRGRGGLRNIDEAKQYFKMLHNNAFSQIMLGIISNNENGCADNGKEALSYFDNAWLLGHPLGLKNASIIRFHNGLYVRSACNFVRAFFLILWIYGVKRLPIVKSPRDHSEILC